MFFKKEGKPSAPPQGYRRLYGGILLLCSGVWLFVLSVEVLGIALLLTGFVALLDGLLILKILRMDVERSKPTGNRATKEELVSPESKSLKV